jgi:antitoxin FitA
MAQLVVRNLEESVKAGLQRRARRNGRSMEAEVREILRGAAHERQAPEAGLGTRLASIVRGTGLKFEVKELRGHTLKPVKFDE